MPNQTPQQPVQAQMPDVSSEVKGQSKVIVVVAIVLLVVFIGLVGYIAYQYGYSHGLNEPVEVQTVITPVSTSTTSTVQDASANMEEDMIYEEETLDLPSWIEDDPDMKADGPWYEALHVASSEDGMEFSEGKLFLEHAGVANLLLTSEDELIATFQYFSFKNEEMFDVIAYAVSDDSGDTWSSVKPLKIVDLPEGANPVDPTLVELNDGFLRLYFTFHKKGDKFPQLYSAKGSSIDSDFINEGQQLDTEEQILDPAVIYYEGEWHHYTVNHNVDYGDDFYNVHSTSLTGVGFELKDDIVLGMSMLGDIVEEDDGIRFYSGSKSAFSEDGYDWTVDEGERVDGADPGVAKLSDGSYMMVYTYFEK